MHRDSDTHGPRVDDELAHELENAIRGNRPARAEEWREPEFAPEDDAGDEPHGDEEGEA